MAVDIDGAEYDKMVCLSLDILRDYPVPTPIEHIYRATSRVMHAKRRSSYHRGYDVVPFRAPDLAILRR